MAAFEDLRQLIEAGNPQPVVDFLSQHPTEPMLVFRMVFFTGAPTIWDDSLDTRQGSPEMLRRLIELYPDPFKWRCCKRQWTPALLEVMLATGPQQLLQCLFDAHASSRHVPSSSPEVRAYLLSRLNRNLFEGGLYTPWDVLFFVAELLGRRKRAKFGLPDELPMLVIDRLGLVAQPEPIFVNYAQHQAALEPQMKEGDLMWYIEYLENRGRADMAAMLEGWRVGEPQARI